MKNRKTLLIVSILAFVAIVGKLLHKAAFVKALQGEYIFWVIGVIIGVIFFIAKCIDGYKNLK